MRLTNIVYSSLICNFASERSESASGYPKMQVLPDNG